MNQKLYEYMEYIFKGFDRLGIPLPYYSITDSGQRVAFNWDVPPQPGASEEDSISLAGELRLKSFELQLFVDDNFIEAKEYDPRINGALEQALEYIRGCFYPRH